LLNTPKPENSDLTAGQGYLGNYYNGLILGAIESALAMFGDEQAWKQLLQWLHHESEIAYRAAGAEALGRVGGSRAADHLIKALHDPAPMVKAAVIWALAQSNEPSAIKVLESLVTTADESDQRWIRRALHYFKVLYSIHDKQLTLAKEYVLPLYVFDSNAVPDNESPAYGSYCQSEVLRALASAVSTRGGWELFNSGLRGCYGDLLEESILQSWLRDGKYGISIDKLDPALVATISSGSKLGFIPYAVGLSRISREILEFVPNFLCSSNGSYKGFITLDGSHNIADLDSELSLPIKLYIQGNRCRGWEVTQELLNEIGLKLK